MLSDVFDSKRLMLNSRGVGSIALTAQVRNEEKWDRIWAQQRLEDQESSPRSSLTAVNHAELLADVKPCIPKDQWFYLASHLGLQKEGAERRHQQHRPDRHHRQHRPTSACSVPGGRRQASLHDRASSAPRKSSQPVGKRRNGVKPGRPTSACGSGVSASSTVDLLCPKAPVFYSEQELRRGCLSKPLLYSEPVAGGVARFLF